MMNSALDELFGILPPGWRVVFLCYGCKHFNPQTFTCPAFPEGISSDIIEGFMPHVTVFRNQVGDYVFEPRPDFKPTELFGPLKDLTRRTLRPKEDIIKWITYKGRRIPIFKKRPPTKTYKALGQLLAVTSGANLEASFRAIKGFSRFLEEKGAEWMTVDDPIWRRHVMRLKDYFPLRDVSHYKTNGNMHLPQILRIHRTLRGLEKRFPGLLSGVHITCVPQGNSPKTKAFVVIDKAQLEGGAIYRSPKFSDLYLNKVFKHAGVVEDQMDYIQMRSARWIPETHLDDLWCSNSFTEYFKRNFGGIEPPLVVFVSSKHTTTRYPSVGHIVHEFGHILHDKRNKFREFMLDVYAPYVGRCVKAGFGKFPLRTAYGSAKLPYLTELLHADAKFRSAVYTPYSLISPFEGYAEAFKGYIVNPQTLSRRWPEAYEFFRKMERGLS